MRLSTIILCLCLSIIHLSEAQPPPIGYWREHLNYRSTIQVLKADQLYCATATNLFVIDANDEMNRYSKINGLNDIGVRCIGWDGASAQLVIAYNNSNLDIFKQGSIKNIGDIKRSTITGDKTINHIFCRNGFAYLSSNLGIVVADLNKYEFKDTWFIGASGAQVKVNAVAADASFIYAATTEGLKKAPHNTDPSDYHNWITLGSSNGLPGGAFSSVAVINNQVITQQKDSLFQSAGNSWNLLYTDPSWNILSITASENKLMVCQQNNAGIGRVIQLSAAGSIEKIDRKSVV